MGVAIRNFQCDASDLSWDSVSTTWVVLFCYLSLSKTGATRKAAWRQRYEKPAKCSGFTRHGWQCTLHPVFVVTLVCENHDLPFQSQRLRLSLVLQLVAEPRTKLRAIPFCVTSILISVWQYIKVEKQCRRQTAIWERSRRKSREPKLGLSAPLTVIIKQTSYVLSILFSDL